MQNTTNWRVVVKSLLVAKFTYIHTIHTYVSRVY